MKNRYLMIRVIAFVLIPVLMSGCSTIDGRQNNEQMVLFDATPRTIDLVCSGRSIETPGSITLKQSRSHTCRASLSGYETKTFRIRSHVSKEGFKASTGENAKRWGWWTLGIGVLIGWTVDLVSGAMRNLDYNDYHITLSKSGTTGTGQAVLAKSVDFSKALLGTPKDIVDTTATAVLDTTIRASAEKMGGETHQEIVHYPSTEEPKQI